MNIPEDRFKSIVAGTTTLLTSKEILIRQVAFDAERRGEDPMLTVEAEMPDVTIVRSGTLRELIPPLSELLENARKKQTNSSKTTSTATDEVPRILAKPSATPLRLVASQGDRPHPSPPGSTASSPDGARMGLFGRIRNFLTGTDSEWRHVANPASKADVVAGSPYGPNSGASVVGAGACACGCKGRPLTSLSWGSVDLAKYKTCPARWARKDRTKLQKQKKGELEAKKKKEKTANERIREADKRHLEKQRDEDHRREHLLPALTQAEAQRRGLKTFQ